MENNNDEIKDFEAEDQRKSIYRENYKKKLYRGINLFLSTNQKYDLSEHQIHQIANSIVEIVNRQNEERDSGFEELYQNAVLEYENARKETHEIVSFIEKNNHLLLDELTRFGVVKTEYDSKKKKNKLVGTSKVVTKIIEFLNSLNDMVSVYYKDIYKVQDNSIVENNKSYLNTQRELF